MADNVVMEKVEDIITCSMCLGVLEKPRTLICLHSYCQGCLEKLDEPKSATDDNLKASASQEASEKKPETEAASDGYECPQCRRFTPKKEVRVVHLIIQLLDAYYAAKKAKSDAKCERCKKKKANWQCFVCKRFSILCDDCKDVHDEFSSEHQTVTFDELIKGSPTINKPVYCTEHKENKLEVFCKKCRKGICVLCKIFHHDGHPAEPITDALKNLLPKLEAGRQSIEENIESNKNDIAGLKEEKAREIARIDGEIRKKEDAIKEQQQVLVWMRTTLERAQGVTLLKELQEGLLEKVEKTALGDVNIKCAVSRCYPWKIPDNAPQQENAINTGYDCARVSLLWNEVWLFTWANPAQALKYNYNCIQTATYQLRGVSLPFNAVEVDAKEGVLAASNGLFSFNQNGGVTKAMKARDAYSDVCITALKQIYALNNSKQTVDVFQKSGSTWKPVKNIKIPELGYQYNASNIYLSNSMTMMNGKIYIFFSRHNAGIVIDENGLEIRRFPVLNTYPVVCGIDSEEHILYASYNCCYVYKTSGNYALNMNYPYHAVYQDQDTLWAVDGQNYLRKYKH